MFARPAEILESRTLLAAVVDSISIDGQAPQVLGEVNGVELLAVSDDDSTRLFSSDGTQAGTIELSDIPLESIFDHQFVGQNLFLIGPNGNQVDLWRTNGQDDGAILVKSDVSFLEPVANRTRTSKHSTDSSTLRQWGMMGLLVPSCLSQTADRRCLSPISLLGFREVSLNLPSDRGAHFEIWINRHDP